MYVVLGIGQVFANVHQITGGTGLLGSHIVSQLLSAGYRVRASARPAKVAQLRASYAKYGNHFEAVAIADVTTDQFPDALVGVDAVIHTASPLPGKADTVEEMLHVSTVFFRSSH